MRRTSIIVAVTALASMLIAVQAQATAPAPPQLDAADQPGDQGFFIVLTITASPDDGGGDDDVVSYRIDRREAGGSYAFLRDVTATDQPQYVVVDQVPLKKRKYSYRVKAYDGAEYSAPAFDSATGLDNIRPQPPRNPKVTDVPSDQGKALLVSFSRSLDDGSGAKDVRLYRISRKQFGGQLTPVAVVRAKGAATYEYTDWGLTPGKVYIYRIAASDGRNSSDPVFAQGQTIDNRKPRPPAGLSVKDRPKDNGDALMLGIKASPDDGARADDVKEYQVFRNPGPEGATALALLTRIPATDAPTYTYTDTGLTKGKQYTYVVRAFDGTSLSDPVSRKGVPLDNVAARAPRGLTVTDVPKDNGGAVKVAFQASPDDGSGVDDVVSYEVFRKRAGGLLAFLKTIPASNSPSYNFTDTGLANDVLYTYRVRAYDGTRYSLPAFGSGKAQDNTAPRPPRNLAVAAAPNALGATDVSFTASEDDIATHPEVTRYEIYRTRAGQAWPTTPTLKVTATQAAGYTARDTGLTVGVKYVYRARAKGLTGFSAYTGWVVFTPTDTRQPGPPRSLTAADRPEDSGNAVIVRWNRSGDDGTGREIVAKYIVFRKLTSVFNPPVTRVKTLDATGAASYQVLDASAALMNLRSYTYWAVAVSPTGVQSVNSNEAEAVPRNDLILAAPTNLTAADRPGGGNAIDLSWKRSSSEGGTLPPPPPFSLQAGDSPAAVVGNYEVFRRRVGQAWPGTAHKVVPAASVQGDPIQVVDSQDVQNGVRYEYKVRYRVDTALSPFSNTATATAKDGATVATVGLAGLRVAIVQAPASVTVGEPVAVRVAVEGDGLSAAHLEWRVGAGAWQSTATRTGRGAYEASFSLMPGEMEAGGVIHVVAVALDDRGEARSEEVAVTVTR